MTLALGLGSASEYIYVRFACNLLMHLSIGLETGAGFHGDSTDRRGLWNSLVVVQVCQLFFLGVVYVAVLGISRVDGRLFLLQLIPAVHELY